MTKLELLKRLHREANIAGSGPLSSVAQSGEYLKLVDWLDDAYLAIQRLHEDWHFLRAEMEQAVTTKTFVPADFARLICKDIRLRYTSEPANMEAEIPFVPWDSFRYSYQHGTEKTRAGKPICFSLMPDGKIILYPTPDNSVTITGEYYRTPVKWPNDTDTVVFPERYEMLVVWWALKYYGANYAEQDQLIHGENEFKQIKRELEFDQLPRPYWGGSLV